MIPRRSALLLLAATPLALRLTPAMASAAPVFASGGIAINGTDPVAYFDQSQPVAGRQEYAVDWNGARWLFSSADNRDRFAADPSGFAPAYGGYCAWAASRGYVADAVLEAWTIHEGRLFLNASLRIRRRWERDIPGNVARADANWPEILG
ncbi:YHS domain-containing (seleno)protein [Nioella aestuarii]|uniref:YHS domain-containing (seleno)protein n=1 Tax=Nioella aestuarii TaxID=1662864 RepID=UPI003D7F679B